MCGLSPWVIILRCYHLVIKVILTEVTTILRRKKEVKTYLINSKADKVSTPTEGDIQGRSLTWTMRHKACRNGVRFSLIRCYFLARLTQHFLTCVTAKWRKTMWREVSCPREKRDNVELNQTSSQWSSIFRMKVSFPHTTTTQGGGGGGGGGRRLVKFSYQNRPTKIDVTSGLIGTQQPVSAKSNDGVWVRHDFFGFLSHRYQELWIVDMKDVV